MGKPLSKKNVASGAKGSAYLDTLTSLISEISALGQQVAFPPPVGVITQYQRTDDGQGIVLQNEAGTLFVARFQGSIIGPIEGKRGRGTPTFGEAVALGAGIWTGPDRRFYSTGSTGLPSGTLPGGLEWSAPNEGDEQIAPAGTVDLAGASSGGMSIPLVLALVGAGYLALKG